MNGFDFIQFIIGIIFSLIVFGIWFLFWQLTRLVYRKLVNPRKNRGGVWRAVLAAVYTMIHISMVLFLIEIILVPFDISIETRIGGLSVFAFMMSYALKDYFHDVSSGIIFVISNWYAEGDIILYEDEEWQVIAVSIFHTTLQNLETRVTSKIRNHYFSEVISLSERLNMDLTLPISVDYADAQSALQRFVNAFNEEYPEWPCVLDGTESISTDGVSYRIHVTCPPSERVNVRRKVYQCARQTLFDTKVTFPYSHINTTMAGS